jgi:hypothetical protein
VIVREYKESDLDALRRMHVSQGFEYPFPDLADPIFVSKLLVENDFGRPVMASLARLTCEMYLLVDRSTDCDVTFGEPPGKVVIPNQAAWSADEGDESVFAGRAEKQISRRPASASRAGTSRNDNRLGAQAARERYLWLLALHAAGQRDLLARGLDDAHAWLPPPIARRFGRRLEALGWVRDDAWTPYCRRLRRAIEASA